ncbi:VPS16 protein, partial [Irena cyanogastra]|nr:VPS16 protein [Irena cyanogastra]
RVLPSPGSGLRCQPWAGAAPHPRFVPVPAEASQEIFRIASMAPGALLLEAQKEYEKESQKADEYLREIREQQLLPEAVGQCIEAAGYEHEPSTQKSLLRAASFGKCFLDKFPPEGFVRMCQDLRVLNAVRDYQIGIPLTFTQYKQLTIEVLLDSCLGSFWGLGEHLGNVLGSGRAFWDHFGVWMNLLGPFWGLGEHMEGQGGTEEIGRCRKKTQTKPFCPPTLVSPVSPVSPVSLSPVYTVVLHLKNELNRGSFFMTLQNQPVALSLYRQFCRHQERETLKDLYNQDDNHQELGNLHVLGGY